MTLQAQPTLVTYRHIWTGKDRRGDHQYEYYCTWSDGSETREFTLPWGRMEGATELPMDAARNPHNTKAAA